MRKCIPLKIVAAVLYAVTTALLLYGLINVLQEPEKTFGIALAAFLIVFVIIFGSIGYLATALLSVVGMIYTKKYNPPGTAKEHFRFFLIFFLLPVLSYAIFFILALVL